MRRILSLRFDVIVLLFNIKERKSSCRISARVVVTSHHRHQVVRARPHLHVVISTWKKTRVGISANSAATHHHQLHQGHVRIVPKASMFTPPRKVANIPANFAAMILLPHRAGLAPKALIRNTSTYNEFVAAKSGPLPDRS